MIIAPKQSSSIQRLGLRNETAAKNTNNVTVPIMWT